jgi:outer membrane protein
MKIKKLLILFTFFAVSNAYAQQSLGKVTLQEAIATALKSNPNITAAQRGIEAAQSRLKQAELSEKPNIQFQSRYSYTSKPTVFGPTTILDLHTQTNAVVLTKPLNTFGRTEAARRQAMHAVSASTEEKAAVIDEVVAGVALAYLQALQARESIRVAEQSVASLEAANDAAKKLREAGAAAKADVLRTEVELARARENVVKAKNAYQEALAALKNAMGVPQELQIEVVPESTNLTVPTEDFTPRRSEVMALEAAVAAAEAAVDAAKRDNKPLLSAYADLQNIAAGSHFPRRNNTASLMLQFTMTVSDGGITKAKVSEAEAQLAQLRERLEAERQRVAMEVRQAQLQLESAEARVAATVTQVESAEESLRVLEVGYREGVNTLTDVLAAQAALEAARYARVAALYDVQIARVRLLRALGRIAEPFAER